MFREMTNDEGREAEDWAVWFGGSRIVREEPSASPKYDLEERTARFGESLIDFANTIPRNPVTDRLIGQLVGAGTSIRANYGEADDAVSPKEFFLPIGRCRKRSAANKALLGHDRARRSGFEAGGARPLARSARTPLNFFKDLRQSMTELAVRHSIIHSSLIIFHRV